MRRLGRPSSSTRQTWRAHMHLLVYLLLLVLVVTMYAGTTQDLVASLLRTAHATAIGLHTSRRASSYVHGPALPVAWPCQAAELSASRPDSLGHLREGVMCGEPVQQKSANHELTSWFQQQSLRGSRSRGVFCFLISTACFVSAHLATVYGVFKHAAAALLSSYMYVLLILPALHTVGNDACSVSIVQQQQAQRGAFYSGTHTPEHAYLYRRAAHVASRYEQS